uniref:Uncharacterized protein n=1 Tax=Acrobeloides nanus TaxID=290746 RepID=A0A914E6E7_9BILA
MLLVFKLPYRLWFDHRVNWYFLYGCFVSLAAFHFIGLYIRLAIIFKKKPYKNLLKPLAIVCFVISGFLFIIATWQLYQLWSIFMVFIITMTYISAISIA